MKVALLYSLAPCLVVILLGPAILCGPSGEHSFSRWMILEGISRGETSRGPQWSPDGNHILTSTRNAMYLIRSDGSKIKRISEAKNKYEYDFFSDISPDGSRIVYVTSRHVGLITKHDSGTGGTHKLKNRNFEIETSTRDGSDRQLLTSNGVIDSFPDWSPSGERIAFARIGRISVWGYDPSGIFTISPDGSDLHRVVSYNGLASWQGLSRGSSHQSGPVWSADGDSLAFVIRTERQHHEIASGAPLYRTALYIVQQDGTGLKQLSNIPQDGRIIGTPAWSSNGQRLAFLYYANEGVTLHTIGSDGSDLQVITHAHEGLKGNVFDSSLQWSPDDTRILFTVKGRYFDSSDWTIYVANADGSGFREIGTGHYVSWSPDGSRIAIFGGHAPDVAISTIATDGSDRRDLAKIDKDKRLMPANVDRTCLWLVCW